MSIWIADELTGERDYPTLGFTAQPNDLLDAEAAPDAFWSLHSDQEAAETVERYTLGGDSSYEEPTDGHVLAWSDQDNTYRPTNLAPVIEANIPERLSEAGLSATFGRVGANVARFVQRARAGEDLSITAVGDSILEGQTVTNPATDGAMILLADDLSDRFGVTVTQTNHASSGYTALTSLANGNVGDAVTDQADLYIVSAFDKNDLGGDIYGLYAPGYPSEASNAALEVIVRAIRENASHADIIVLATNPYASGSSSNAHQLAKIEKAKRVAAAYGCEFVNAYQAFVDQGDYSAFLTDSTHPNTAGHRLIADTLLAHLADQDKTPVAPGAPAASGIYQPQKVNTGIGEYGYIYSNATGTFDGWAWTNGGTGWTGTGGSGSPYTTTTAGDYIEVTGTIEEVHALLSTAAADALVADVTVDSVLVADNQSFTEGKQGNYYVPLAVGLDPDTTHTVRVTLVSGTMRAQRTAAKIGGGAAFTQPPPQVVDLGTVAASTAIDSAGGFTNHINNVVVPLPAGWGSMLVEFMGDYTTRREATATTDREFNVQLLADGNYLINTQLTFPGTTVRRYHPMGIAQVYESDEDVTVLLRTRLLSTDKGNCLAGYGLKAKLTRLT